MHLILRFIADVPWCESNSSVRFQDWSKPLGRLFGPFRDLASVAWSVPELHQSVD